MAKIFFLDAMYRCRCSTTVTPIRNPEIFKYLFLLLTVVMKFVIAHEGFKTRKKNSMLKSFIFDKKAGIAKHCNDSGFMQYVVMFEEKNISSIKTNVVNSNGKFLSKHLFNVKLQSDDLTSGMFTCGLKLLTNSQKEKCCFFWVVFSYVSHNPTSQNEFTTHVLIGPPFVGMTKFDATLQAQKNSDICSFVSCNYYCFANVDLSFEDFAKHFRNTNDFMNYKSHIVLHDSIEVTPMNVIAFASAIKLSFEDNGEGRSMNSVAVIHHREERESAVQATLSIGGYSANMKFATNYSRSISHMKNKRFVVSYLQITTQSTDVNSGPPKLLWLVLSELRMKEVLTTDFKVIFCVCWCALDAPPPPHSIWRKTMTT
jgi:hypothetical protein